VAWRDICGPLKQSRRGAWALAFLSQSPKRVLPIRASSPAATVPDGIGAERIYLQLSPWRE
jgi:hypothetical protein